jgi:hypothetical protein
MSRYAFPILPLLFFASVGAQTQGFLVRFLANLDATTKYSVYRSNTPGSVGLKIGEVIPTGKDTLEFGDLNVVKGTAYFYSVTGTFASGLESDFSSQSAVAYPSISLPDTIRSLPGIAAATFVLDAKMDPLANIAPLDAQIEGTSPFNVQFVPGTHSLVVTSKLGLVQAGKVKIRTSYYGQFQDLDSTVVVISTTAAINPAFPVHGQRLTVSPLQPGSLLFSHLPASGELQIFTLQGTTAFKQRFAGGDGTLVWDGRIQGGSAGSQLLSYRVHDKAGGLAGSGLIHFPR